ncbi:MAG: putative bifunctional diguanylate cyclase/phosphodiesterase [Actinomycetota bacterium]
MPTWTWKCFVALGVVVGVAHFTVDSVFVQTGFYLGLGLAGVVATLVGVRRHRPEYRTPWYLFAAGLALFLAGDGFFYFYKVVRHVDRPFPSVADACYLASYPLLAGGLLLLLRRRTPGGDRTSLIDASIIATASGVLAWVYLMAPSLAGSTPLLERLISMSYPLMDLVLLAVAARSALGAGSRRPAYHLLGGAVVCLLGADIAYAVIQLTGSFDVGSPFDAGWMGFYVLWGAAALHPSMRTLSAPAPVTEARFGRARLVLLGAVVLLSPAALGVEAVRGVYTHVPVFAAGSGVLFLLVTARMSGLMSDISGTAVRERALRRAAAALVASTDRDTIYRSALRAARDLAGDHVVCRLVDGRAGEHRVVAADGGMPVTDADVDDVGALRILAADAGGGRHELLPGRHEDLLRSLALDASTPFLLVVPVEVHGAIRGAFVLAAASTFASGVGQGMETLSSQLALALESAAVTEDLHLRQSEARFRSLVQNSSDAITLLDAGSVVRYQTPSVEHVLGYRSGDLLETRLLELIHADDRPRMSRFLDEAATAAGVRPAIEVKMRHADGGWLDVESIANNMLGDDNVRGIVLTTRDISERKHLERQLTHQALHDSLTGLANRALFIDRIEHALDRQTRETTSLAVLFIDLDDFKTVNDGLGHTVGDQALVAVAERLSLALRSGDTAARLGGDEFGVLLEGIEDPSVAYEVGARLLEQLKEPFTVDGNLLSIEASLGIVVSSAGNDAIELLRNADVAMYKAKGQGKGRFEVFEVGMHAAVVERLELKADLGRALENGEFVSHYQPIVRLSTGRIVGVEALVRWQHPTRGLLPPYAFIGLAEDTGLIVPIGLDVLRDACRQVLAWDSLRTNDPPLRVSVNLSARQLQNPALVSDVSRTLAAVGIDPARVTLEITESILMSDTESSVATLRRLKNLGVALALDDFGTGYSSLSYLQRFPVDMLKLDKSFVDGLGQGEAEDSRLARAIIGLGRMLHMQITAEGIEQPVQLHRLRELGCDLGQGYHFARPLPGPEMEALLGVADAIAGVSDHGSDQPASGS